ncbi:MAG: TonB-dependent receptor [Flaviaesturariibacter sp.]|nr:TonB-dependent receptor [Flaviaesturariibacter sp.]
MKQIVINRFFVALFLLCCVAASPAADAQKNTISGFVRDSMTQKPLAYATAELFQHNDLAHAVRSAFTSDQGRYVFTNLDTGRYTVILSHTSFGEKQVTIAVSGGAADAGTALLAPSAATLQGVVVRSRKPLVEQADDKIVFNVENDPTAKTESAIDILRKTPYVSVDGDGNIQVNGQSNFKVLLNGRETAMFAQNVKEALKGFPGAVIVKIEVITTPSAKYDAEGIGGIINIVTKKKVVGYNGSINTYSTNIGSHNLNANVSAKLGKVGVSIYYGAGGGHKIPGTSLMTYVPTDANAAGYSRRTLTGSRNMTNFWNYGNGEVSYEMDSLNTLSLYGNISGGHNRNKYAQDIRMEYPSAPDTVGRYTQDNRNEYPTTSIGADYIRKFSGNKEKEFSIRLNGEFGETNSFLNSLQDNAVSNDRYVQNSSESINKQYTVQSDYVLPLPKGRKLESGVKAILRRASSDFTSRERASASEDFKTNATNTDYFSYDQNVYSAYSTYAIKVNKTTFRLGGRYEYTTLDGSFTSGKTTLSQTYSNLLPNVQVNTKLGKTTLVFSYGQRLQRPSIYNLNPFVNNNDLKNISYGNPDLQPQLIHNLSAQARVTKGKTFIGLTLSTSYSDNMIVQYARMEGSTVVTTSGNIGKEKAVNLSGNVNARINADWSLSVNGNVRWSQVSNRMAASESASGLGGNANLNTTYSMNKRFTIDGYAGFYQSPVTFQSKYPLNVWYGIGAGYKMFGDKLTISAGLANFLQKNRVYKTVTTTPAFQYISRSTLPNRGISLSVSWTFGKLTENVSKKKGVSNDDLLKSPGS